MASACNTHVDAFWSNKDQNGVTSAKSTSTRKTERTPAIASTGCMLRTASSWSQTPSPPNAITPTSARQAEMTNPNFDMSRNDPTAEAAAMATRTWPRRPEAIASRETRRNECGFGGAGGTITYCLRPSHKTAVEMNMSTPGIPKANAGPRYRRKIGIKREAKNEPKLMIQ